MKYVVKEYEIVTAYGEKEYDSIVVGIGKEDEGIVKPSPLTNFIKQRYRRKNKSINSQKGVAYAVCKFLNYCIENRSQKEFSDLREEGIYALKRKHASHYISYLSTKSHNKELTPQYVKSEINYLNEFYNWLQEQGIMTEEFETFYVEKKKLDKREVSVMKKVDVFEKDDLGTIYPPRRNIETNKLVDFGRDRVRLTELFLQTVYEEYPEIYLGVCLQFYAGLRRGEVLNLLETSIKKVNENLVIEVRDNAKEIFKNKKNTSGEQVKVERNQGVFFSETIERALEYHNKWIQTYKKANKIKNKALFISKRTKEPISFHTYTNFFDKSKEVFLNKLLEQNDIKNYKVLSEYSWSTHIGRGVFTNLCLESGMNVTEVAIARGDSNTQSVINYIDKRNVQVKLTEALEVISNNNKKR